MPLSNELELHAGHIGMFLEVENSLTTKALFGTYSVLNFLRPISESVLMLQALKETQVLSFNWVAIYFFFPALFEVISLITCLPSAILLYGVQYLPPKKDDAYAKNHFLILLLSEWMGLSFFSVCIKASWRLEEALGIPNKLSWKEYFTSQSVVIFVFTFAAAFTSIISIATPISVCGMLLFNAAVNLVCSVLVPSLVIPSNFTLARILLLIHCVYALYMNIFVRDAWRMCTELLPYSPEDRKYEFITEEYMEKSELQIRNIAKELEITSFGKISSVYKNIAIETHPDKTERSEQKLQLFLKVSEIYQVRERHLSPPTRYIKAIGALLEKNDTLANTRSNRVPDYRYLLFNMVIKKFKGFSLEIYDCHDDLTHPNAHAKRPRITASV